MMLFAKVQADKVLKFPYSVDDLQMENPHTRFNFSIRSIEQFYAQTEEAVSLGSNVVNVVLLPNPGYIGPPKTYRRDDIPQLLENGLWVLGWHEDNLTDEEIIGLEDKIHQEISSKIENIKESNSWVYQANNGTYTEKQAEWQKYFDNLDDLKHHPSYPFDVKFPFPPPK